MIDSMTQGNLTINGCLSSLNRFVQIGQDASLSVICFTGIRSKVSKYSSVTPSMSFVRQADL